MVGQLRIIDLFDISDILKNSNKSKLKIKYDNRQTNCKFQPMFGYSAPLLALKRGKNDKGCYHHASQHDDNGM